MGNSEKKKLAKPKVGLKKKLKMFIKPAEFIFSFLFIILVVVVMYGLYSQLSDAREKSSKLSVDAMNWEKKHEEIEKEIVELKNVDQYVRNEELQKEIEEIEDAYTKSVLVYEDLIKLKENVDDTDELDVLYTKILVGLSERKYEESLDKLGELDRKINERDKKYQESIAQKATPVNVPESNTPPGAGYSRQTVSTDVGSFVVSMVGADLASTKVIVDTASDSDCHNDCPRLPLSEMVARNNAYAGVHGAYYCPVDYPSCAGKTNSFDLLIMNKNKHYFNSDNNVYSSNPAVIFGNGWIRFVQHASEWGRDTGVDGVLSNFPLMVFNNEVKFSGDDDTKKTVKSSRGFVANKGNTVYIGIVFGASVSDSAQVMKSLGMENAINLDGGGTTAFWSGGYKAGPGRELTNAILFVRK